MKTYIKALQLIIKITPGRFFMILILSIIVGALEGMQLKLNIIVLSTIQHIIEGKADYTALIVPFSLWVIICPSYYIYTPADSYLRSLLLQKMKLGLLNCIYNKAYKADMVLYENPSLYDHIHRAEESISSNRFMSIMDSIVYIPLFFSAIASIVIVLGTYNRLLILLAFFSMIPFFIARIIQGKGYFKMRTKQTQKVRIMNYLWEVVCGRNTNRDIRVYGIGGYLTKKFVHVLDDVTDEAWEYEKRQFWITVFFDSIRPIGLGMGILIASYMVYKGQITLAVFAAMSTALSEVQEFTEGLMTNISKTISNLPFLENFFKFINQPDPIEGDNEINDTIHEIEFRNVSFRYPSSTKDTIKNLNLKINKNESISILGENGAGKSTFVKLLFGFYKPSSGKILYNGINIENISQSSLLKKMSSVFQDFTRYNLTIRENIGFGAIEKMHDSSYIVEHIKKLGVNDFIEGLPNGLDTILGKEYGGTDLSGGQWQKVAIARGSIRKSDIIILDEPTASLDPLAEAAVFKKFSKIASGKTSIIISHRVGSASLASRIIMIKDGRIVEDGSHDELLQQNGEYADIYKMQATWYT